MTMSCVSLLSASYTNDAIVGRPGRRYTDDELCQPIIKRLRPCLEWHGCAVLMTDEIKIFYAISATALQVPVPLAYCYQTKVSETNVKS